MRVHEVNKSVKQVLNSVNQVINSVGQVLNSVKHGQIQGPCRLLTASTCLPASYSLTASIYHCIPYP